MWRRVYLLILVFRIYFALSPSYIHPDEVFQGPEIVAGTVFEFPCSKTWEWTVAKPIRSAFPLWLTYGIPSNILKSLWPGDVPPQALYYTLRLCMFALTFVLEDWAIFELVHSPKRRNEVVLLVASSYVTWTYQTHTFSNSVETLLVLWCLVLMHKITHTHSQSSSSTTSADHGHPSRRSYIASSFLLGFLLVFGVFNRITFPAFLIIPGAQLLPHLFYRPLALFALILSTSFWLFAAIATDTAFYHGGDASNSFRALYRALRSAPVFTPLNNILYNSKAANLKEHGLHPHYQHIVANIPLLLGPALLLLLRNPRDGVEQMLHNSRLTSAITGILILSIIPHQEPRFLLPCVPLLLTCVTLPRTRRASKLFWWSWAVFNLAMSVLMGIYHQGGVIPMQTQIPDTVQDNLMVSKSTTTDIHIYWWKTYPPPTYLLGSPLTNPNTGKPLNLTTLPLLGVSHTNLISQLDTSVARCPSQVGILAQVTNILQNVQEPEVFLVAPLSARPGEDGDFTLSSLAVQTKHVNLDDLDFADDGVLATLRRVVGQKGLGLWSVHRNCSSATS